MDYCTIYAVLQLTGFLLAFLTRLIYHVVTLTSHFRGEGRVAYFTNNSVNTPPHFVVQRIKVHQPYESAAAKHYRSDKNQHKNENINKTI